MIRKRGRPASSTGKMSVGNFLSRFYSGLATKGSYSIYYILAFDGCTILMVNSKGTTPVVGAINFKQELFLINTHSNANHDDGYDRKKAFTFGFNRVFCGFDVTELKVVAIKGSAHDSRLVNTAILNCGNKNFVFDKTYIHASDPISAEDYINYRSNGLLPRADCFIVQVPHSVTDCVEARRRYLNPTDPDAKVFNQLLIEKAEKQEGWYDDSLNLTFPDPIKLGVSRLKAAQAISNHYSIKDNDPEGAPYRNLLMAHEKTKREFAFRYSVPPFLEESRLSPENESIRVSSNTAVVKGNITLYKHKDSVRQTLTEAKQFEAKEWQMIRNFTTSQDESF